MSKDLDIFIDALRREGFLEGFNDYLTDVSRYFFFRAYGKITYEMVLRLYHIDECYDLRIDLRFTNDCRNTRLVSARKISLDEYILLSFSDSINFRDTYMEMVKVIHRR